MEPTIKTTEGGKKTAQKEMINIMMYHVIANQEDDIKLSIMENHKELYMPSITFTREGKEDIYYDNPAFLFHTLYESLQKYVDRKMENVDEVVLEELLEDLNQDRALDIIEILEKGIELGWNKVK